MARQRRQQQTDQTAVRTVRFGWNGENYEVELDDARADEFASRMERFVTAARPVRGARRRASKSNPQPAPRPRKAPTPSPAAKSTPATKSTPAAKNPPAAKSAPAATKWTGDGEKASPATIRAWAQDNGMDVPARGRIPNAVLEAYAAGNAPAKSGGRSRRRTR